MAPKRKNDDAGEPSARERKKLKMAGARTISVQETATSTGSGSSLADNQRNAVASSSTGPSKTVVRFDSTCFRTPCCRMAISMVRLAMQGLPASLDVERFTEVRVFRCIRVAVTNDRLGARIRD